MTVLDADGTEIGKVEFVRMGDPEAVSAVGEEAPGGEPHVAGELRDRLLRMGFIKIDRKGFLRPDAYAAADEIAHVQDARVHLVAHDKNLLNEAV